MGACEMERIRDALVADALARVRLGDAPGAQELLDRAALVWPLEPEQVDAARAAFGATPLLDPNRPRG